MSKHHRPSVIDAKAIASHCCDHGNVHVDLYDADGELVATASIDSTTAIAFGEQYLAALRTATEMRLTNGHVGHG